MNYKIVSSISELPDPKRIKRLFKDAETSSDDPKLPGSKPYHGDRAVGVALTHDDNPTAYYIPLRHRGRVNLFSTETTNVPIEQYVRYMNDVVGRRDVTWVNHNVKFDAHFDAVEGINVECDLEDTLVQARVVDMQRHRSGYGLKELDERWCGTPPTEKDMIRAELKANKSKDYGSIDASILGEYGCADVQKNRRISEEIARRRYPEDDRVWAMENALTRSLFKIERRGVKIKVEDLEIAKERALCRMAEIESEVKSLGIRCDLSAPKSVLYFVTQTLGLPVVAYTKEGNPSMSGDAIREYLELDRVEADGNLTKFFKLLDEYRDRAQFHGLYAEGWMDWIVDGEIHPMYKQTVATGRMACEDPNFQQLNGEAKTLVIPRPGMAFLRRDYSQIEYRIIAALSRDPRVIEAYRNDPTTDFHDFVAKLCGIPRKPAKNVNFGIAFGMGEEGLIKQLARLLGGATAEAKAKEILTQYDGKFPRVKSTANEVKKICRQRAGWVSGEVGWVRTLYGRRRALTYWKWGEGNPKLGQIDDTRKAFNTVVQGTAADIMKDRVPHIDNDPWLIEQGIRIVGIIHDELLFEGPIENCTPEAAKYIDRLMCTIPVALSVPLMTDGGISAKNWKEAG